jgi:hypothetical protein
MNTDRLIDTLVAEGAKRPLPHPFKQTLLLLGGTMVWLVTLSVFHGFRFDIWDKFSDHLYVLELGFLFLMTMSSCLAALCLSRPDGQQMPWIRFVPFGFLVLWTGVAFTGASDISWTSIFHTVTLCQFSCAWHILIFSVPPSIAMFLTIRKGAPIQCCWAGSMATLSVTALGYLWLRLVELNDNPLHLIVWHVLPIMVICLVGMMAGKYILRWR